MFTIGLIAFEDCVRQQDRLPRVSKRLAANQNHDRGFR